MKTTERSIPFGRKLLFSMAAVLLFLTLIEITSRVFLAFSQVESDRDALPLWVISNLTQSNFLEDRVLFWRVPKSEPRLFTNSFGLRGDEISLTKETGVYRIITLGDSCTWGFGVNPGQEYPNLLQQLLNQTLLPFVFEVQNAGVPGYSSLQGKRYLETELHRLEPDMITLYFGRNDARFLTEEGGYAPDHEVPIVSPFIYTLRQQLNKSGSFRLLRSFLIHRKNQQPESSGSQRGQSMRPGRNRRIEEDEFDTNLRSMIRYAQEHQYRILTITSPVFPPDVGNYNHRVRGISEEMQVDILDAEAEFMKHDGNGWLVDDCHPNPSGHQWLAEQIKEFIVSRIIEEQFQ